MPVKDSYLGRLRQAQRNLDRNHYVQQLAFEHQNVEDLALPVCGVNLPRVTAGQGCKALCITGPKCLSASLREAQGIARKHSGPIVGRGISRISPTSP